MPAPTPRISRGPFAAIAGGGLLVATLAFAAPPTTATAASGYTIKTNSGSVARIGQFRPSKNPTLSAAQRVFGPASAMKNEYGLSGCRVDWKRLRLRIHFLNLGGQDACSPVYGFAQSFTVRSSRFRTWGGLRVGNRSSTILDKHPWAEYRDDKWWLTSAVSPFGDGGDYPVVSAITRGGRVRSLSGWIGAAGE